MKTHWLENTLRKWRDKRQPETLGELLKSQRDRAYSVALRLTGSPADAEDVVQEALIKLLSREKGFETARDFEITVYRAVTQCALDWLRKKRRAAAREARAARAAEESKRNAEGNGGVNVSEEERTEISAKLQAAVAELPEEERAPVVLAYYQGLSVVETAHTLELPRGTVRARLQRALHKLRTKLREERKEVSAAMILGMLWEKGVVAAPGTLTAALDSVLPGVPCAKVAALAQAGPALVPAAVTGMGGAAAAAAAGAAGGLGGIKAAVVILVGTATCVSFVAADKFRPKKETSGKTTPVPALVAGKSSGTGTQKAVGQGVRPQTEKRNGRNFVKPSGESRGTSKAPKRQEEEKGMKKVGALLPAVAFLLPGAVSAGEPNPAVNQIIAKIEARRAAKAKAAAQVKHKPRCRVQRGGVRRATDAAAQAEEYRYLHVPPQPPR